MKSRWVLFAVLAMVACGKVWADQPAYEFRQNYRDGEKFNMLFGGSTTMSYQRNFNGRSVDKIKAVDAWQSEGVLTVLNASDGNPIAQQIQLDPASGEFSQVTGERPQQKYEKLAGKTITVRRGLDNTVMCDVDGNDEPRLAYELRNWLNRDTELFPDHPVLIKDKWDVSQKLSQTMTLADDQQVFAFGKLISVQTVKGREFAQVLVSLAFVGHNRRFKSLRVEAQMEGTAWVDMANGRIAKMDLAGERHETGTVTVSNAGRGQITLEVAGEGKIQYHQLCLAAKGKTPTEQVVVGEP